jgi:hypothetical protein
MDTPGSVSPYDSSDLPRAIFINEKGMTGAIVILPLVKVGETQRLIAQRWSLERRAMQHLSLRKSRHDREELEGVCVDA